MKICPKCHSSYSDETLNFCLTDGVPLVVEEAFGDHQRLTTRNSGQHSSWQEAETLHDSGFVFPFQAGSSSGGASEGHTTSPNSGSPTFTSSASHPTAATVNVLPPPSTPQKKSSNLVLFSIVGTLLALGIATGVFWYFSGSNEKNAATWQNATPMATVEVKKTSVALSPEQENQIKKEIGETIETWRSSIEKHDIDTHIKSYVAQLDNYYKESGIHREHVRADRLRAFERYPSIDLHVDNMKITAHSMESATVVFDKSWTFKRPERTSTGSVEQEMALIKQNGKWLINGEKDSKVYYINNRDNAAAPGANQTNGSNTTNVNSNQ
jgi:hypothetical protein